MYYLKHVNPTHDIIRDHLLATRTNLPRSVKNIISSVFMFVMIFFGLAGFWALFS